MKNIFLRRAFPLTLLIGISSFSLSATNIVTKAGAIRNCIKADINGKEMTYISEEDGTVSLSSLDGKLLWRNPSDDPAVMFEIMAKDIDGDNNDDLLGVSGNGSVYAWKSTGKLLWKYTTSEISRLSEIATIGHGKNIRIFAAGNDFKLYELNSKGKLLSVTPIKGTARTLESGDFIEDGKEVLFLHTYSHDKFRSMFFGFIDPDTKKVLKSSDIKKLTRSGAMVTDKLVADVNKDGKDDILLFSTDKTCEVLALDGDFKRIFKFNGSKDSQRYAHARGTVLSPVADQVVMQFGGVIYLIDFNGKLIKRVGTPHQGMIYNSLVLFPKSKMLVGAGEIGGDNTLYTYNLKKSDWINEKQSFGGLYAQVKDNLNTLYNQALSFKLPSYQTKRDKNFTVLGLSDDKLNSQVRKLNGGNILMVSQGATFTESTSRDDLVAAIGKDALKIDKRGKYDHTSEQIVEWAREQEKKGQPFQMWVGHGTDPFYVRINTLEKILQVAPTTCYGFIYAEMDGNNDPRVQYFVKEYMPRLAAAIHKYKTPTKIYFRYKNMFWGADAHESLWREVFFSKKYSDILVPSAEDTNNRLQDINFTGRVGMFLSGYVDNYAMRLVDDNPTSWRPLSPGGQRSVSPYLRNAAIMASYGCSSGVLFPIKYLEEPGYNILFALIKSGIIPMLNREDILSVGSWDLIKNIDQEYLESVNKCGHDLTLYTKNDDNAVISKAGVHWCGASTTDYDYSKIANGVDYRWLNFIPKMPNGIVPITTSDYAPILDKEGKDYFVNNLRYGIIEDKFVDSKAFGLNMRDCVEAGAKKMLMRVDGVSWSLFKIDNKHARLILVDPSYVSPSNRTAKIHFQNKMPKSAIDILSKEKIAVGPETIEIQVPAGSMRFIDFEYDGIM